MHKNEAKEIITKVLTAADIGIQGIDSISFENGYLLGKYGATPDIGDFTAIKKDN